MIALLQRVTAAHVAVDSIVHGEISRGLLAFIGVERGDAEPQAIRLVERILSYRMFADDAGKMNLSLVDIQGGLLLVPQFTLAADTTQGNRPGFTPAASPADGRLWFERVVALARAHHPHIATGVFGADMRVHLINDGPVTFWLRVPPTPAAD